MSRKIMSKKLNVFLMSKLRIKTNIDITSFCLSIIFLCCALFGFIPQTMLSSIILICVFIICLYGDSIVLWPIMIFYYSVFGTLFGISIYRLFTLMFLFFYFYRTKKVIFSKKILFPLLVYIFYLAFVVMPHSLKTMVFSCVDIICVVVLIQSYLNNEINIKKFFNTYLIISFIAFFTGLIINNDMTVMQNYGGELVTVSRFNATFEDPNYMGFFYTIAVFSIISLKLYTPFLRRILVLLLYCIILSSLSMSAIIGNILLWICYLFIRGDIKLKTIVIIIFMAILIYGIYIFGLNNPDFALLGNMSLKIEDKMNSFFNHNFDSFSTGRTALSEVHLKVFRESSLFSQLFGGKAVNAYFIDVASGANFSAHNEYIDMLLNVGVIGWLIMYGYIFANVIRKTILYKKSKNELYICGAMLNLTWLYYVATLTVFLDFRFMFAFLI